ncbi:hypothetical protein HanOQP8_Chr09g0312671 [Helianthus annuus]|nr:hypothetical protein HanOQP8_Chr09g0312671 [Helianthus annuus]
MSTTDHSVIRSVLTKEDLESFVAAYQIPERFSPSLPGPDDPAVCTPEKIVLYTLAFSFCGVSYPLSPFKVELLKHFGIHFSQLHPLTFMRVLHFKLSCVAVSGEPSVVLFCMFYKLQSDGDWFTFAKRKDSATLSYYSFMPISTYPKEWKNRFIFVSACSFCERNGAVEEDVWASYKGLQLSRRAFGHGGPEPSLFCSSEGLFWEKRDVVTGDVLEGWTLEAGDLLVTRKGEKTPSRGEDSSEKAKGSQGSLLVKNSSSDEPEDMESRLIRKQKGSPEVGSKVVIPEPRNIRSRLRSASSQKPFPMSKVASEIPPTNVKGSLSKHLKTLRVSSSLSVGLPCELKTSQTVAAELQCRVTDAERKLLEEKNDGALLEQREKAWEQERRAWMEEKEDLVAELKHHKEATSISGADVETLYTDWGMAMDDNQKLAQEHHCLISQGFGLFLSAFSRSE